MKQNANYIILIAILFYLLFLSSPTKQNRQTQTINIDTVLVFDTIKKNIRTPLKTEIEALENKAPAIVDTAKIIANYFKKNLVKREFNDSNINVMLVDTLEKNRITGSFFEYKITKPKLVLTKHIKEPKKNQWYLGIAINGSSNSFGIGPSLLLVDKNRKALGISTNIISEPNATINIMWNL